MNKDKQIAEKTGVLYNKTSSSNPINNNGIIARINSLNTKTNSNKAYRGYLQHKHINFATADYNDLIQSLNEISKGKKNINDLFCSIHNVLVNKLNCGFTALGIYHPQSNYVNLKLIDRIGGTYSSKVFSSEENNPLIACYKDACPKVIMDSSFINIPYIQNSPVAILPLLSVNDCLGVMLIGDTNAKNNLDLYSLLSQYTGLFMQNSEFIQNSSENCNIDTLTLLSNHRGFQEILTKELSNTEARNSQLSVIVMDINHISKINRELGHAKGDEIIKLLAEKVKQNK